MVLPSSTTVSLVPVVDLLELNSLREFSVDGSLLQRVSQERDAIIHKLKHFIVNQWPISIPAALLPYSKSRDEYSVQSGIVYRGCRILPPSALRGDILRLLHTGHPGICRMLRLARQNFWWPSIDSDINAFRQRYATCQINAQKRSNARLSSWGDTEEFLERVHVDVAFFHNTKLLVFVDAFSRWVDVHVLKDLSSAVVI